MIDAHTAAGDVEVADFDSALCDDPMRAAKLSSSRCRRNLINGIRLVAAAVCRMAETSTIVAIIFQVETLYFCFENNAIIGNEKFGGRFL